MRKLGIALLLIVLLIFGGLYMLAFTQTGNNILKPYIEDAISKKIKKDVKIDRFKLTTNHLSLQVDVQKQADLIVDGDIKILDRWFDLLYYIQAQNLKTPTIIIRDAMEVKGGIKGFMDNFTIKGRGKAFSSNIDFDVHLVDNKPLNGHVNAKKLNIAQILEFVAKPPYSNGFLNVNASIQNQNDILKGKADLLAYDANINTKLIKRDFNISLPENTKYVGKVNGIVKDDIMHLTSQIVSNLATVKTQKTKINLKSMNISSDYDLKIPKLEDLEFITKKKLYGDLHVNGDLKKSKDDLILSANSKIFDGTFNSILHNNTLKASGQKFQIKKILALLGEPALSYGLVDFKADVDDIKKQKANLKLHVKDGELVGSHMKSRFDINLPPITNFAGLINAKIEDDKLQADTDIKTSIANLKSSTSLLDLKTQDFYSDFDLHVENLKNLGKIIDQDIRGKINLKGDVEFKGKKLALNANTKSLGGNLDAKLADGTLEANLENIELKKIVYILNKPDFATGDINAKAKFSGLDSKSLNGQFNYTLKNGILLKEGLKELTQTNVPQSYTFDMKSDVNVKNSIAYFTNTINSQLASLPSFKGNYDINKKILDSEYEMDIKELSKLEFITKQKLHGPLHVKGIAQLKNDNLKTTADAPILGGMSNSVYDKNILTTKANGISIKGLCDLMGLPYVFDSKGDFNLNYNTKSKKGDYSLVMAKGHMVKNQLTDLVKTFSMYDMTKEVYNNTTLKGAINDTKASYQLDMNGSQTAINVPNGIYDMSSGKTKANFKLRFQKTDVKGSIWGQANSPKVSIDSSNYLQNKAKDAAEKAIDKYIPQKQKGLVKDLLKLF